MYIYCICLTSAYVFLCSCNIRHRYQKRFKVHFSVWNWRLSKMNEENVMHSAEHRKIINNIKRFVRILLKLPTKKISRKHTSKISKEKNLSFMSSSFYNRKSFFYRIKWPPLNVTIFITHVRNLRNGCYAYAPLTHG